AVSSPQTYSTIHNIDNRQNLTKEEWDYFTSKSTKQALRELAASKTFTDWLIEHPDRVDRISLRSNCHTKQDVAKIATSPGFISWFVDHPDRIKLDKTILS
ncbi:hypothetical protein A2U01_0045005, partial [Trifolium medium]|nr:hypothetical protein [Trifolium medium]